jgi:hypothetical protein
MYGYFVYMHILYIFTCTCIRTIYIWNEILFEARSVLTDLSLPTSLSVNWREQYRYRYRYIYYRYRCVCVYTCIWTIYIYIYIYELKFFYAVTKLEENNIHGLMSLETMQEGSLPRPDGGEEGDIHLLSLPHSPSPPPLSMLNISLSLLPLKP